MFMFQRPNLLEDDAVLSSKLWMKCVDENPHETFRMHWHTLDSTSFDIFGMFMLVDYVKD